MCKYQVEDFAIDGKYKEYAWNVLKNPNATIQNGLANCTTMAIALSYVLKTPYPVTRIVSANNWHRVLINGWTAKPYGSCDIKVGDIIEWDQHVHVATVIAIKEGEPYLGCSWYTGEHGVSVYNGQYDTRNFYSLKELSDFMIKNYPFRTYHECSLYEEANRVGGLPEYVLSAPETIPTVSRDPNRNQIQVLTNEQNIRDGENNIVGVAQSGFYNVLSTKELNGYIWYEVKKNRFIAGVEGRVVYLPSDDVDAIKKENAELKSALKQINEIIKRWL